jgi:hypothetical protein
MAGREHNEDIREELWIYDLNLMIKKLLKKAIIFGNIAWVTLSKPANKELNLSINELVHKNKGLSWIVTVTTINLM